MVIVFFSCAGSGAAANIYLLSHFYDLDHLLSFAAANNISLTQKLHSNLVPACVAQLQFTPKPSVDVDLPIWAKKFRVICLHPEFTWEHLGRDDQAGQPGWVPWRDLRGALVPSKNWEAQIDAVMELARVKIVGFDQGFHVVHARTEREFLRTCLGLNWDITVYCYVSEVQITEFLLKKWSIKQGELVFVSSDAKISELTVLCTTFRCFDLPSFWPEIEEKGYLEQAQIRYLFSLRGKDVFGNQVSTFFGEIAQAFVELGKYAVSYNQPCDSHTQNCTLQPDWDFQNETTGGSAVRLF